MKYFHELTDEEREQLMTGKVPGFRTFGDLEKGFVIPDWCGYGSEALHGVMGCWSLVGGLVTGEDYCRACDLHRPPPPPAAPAETVPPKEADARRDTRHEE